MIDYTIRLELNYWTIVSNKKLSKLLGISKDALDKGILGSKDVVSIKIDEYNTEILDVVKDIILGENRK